MIRVYDLSQFVGGGCDSGRVAAVISGFGRTTSYAQLGRNAQHLSRYLRDAPWTAIAPGSLIFVSVLAFNLLGDGLRDALDPKGNR
jgi:ABC-type dipeptide/oligopeptide/nickel transport system permease subunit